MKDSSQYLYASIGAQFSWFLPDLTTHKLDFISSKDFDSNIQYVWAHPQKEIIYLALSDGGPGKKGSYHSILACSIDRNTGEPSILGPKQRVPYRPIHLSTDEKGENLFTAYNNPSSLSVHKIEANGNIGDTRIQLSKDQAGIFGHQVRIIPDEKTAILVCRGYDATDTTAEQPGCLKIFDLTDGELRDTKTISPFGGLGFGARHLDFHPSGHCFYLALERQSELHTFKIAEEGISDHPLFTASTLSKPLQPGVRQANSAVHVHPSGKFVYVSNRTYPVAPTNGRAIPNGEDNIAVFKINEISYEPSLIQSADTLGSLPRTFSIHNSGKMLVAANSEAARKINFNGKVTSLPLSLVCYEIGENGKLALKQQINFQDKDQLLFWAGFL